ncbi:MAG: hypothetical protein RMJ88_16120 [Thermogemmata sp.]|nr:hypothetical protein [Thermogemmata sp.]
MLAIAVWDGRTILYAGTPHGWLNPHHDDRLQPLVLTVGHAVPKQWYDAPALVVLSEAYLHTPESYSQKVRQADRLASSWPIVGWQWG